MSFINARNEANSTGLRKYRSAAGWALAGLILEIAGSPILKQFLDAKGIVDPMSQRLGQLALDVAAATISGYGVYELLKKLPGEPRVKAYRQILVQITDGVEEGITLLSFFVATATFEVHLGQGLYDNFR